MMNLEALKKYRFDTEVMLAISIDPSSQKLLEERLEAINAEIAIMEKEEENHD